MDAISESLLSTEVQELHLQNKEWMSLALFLIDESRFFRKLFGQHQIFLNESCKSSQVSKFERILEKQIENIQALKVLISEHQHVLERILKDPDQKISISLLEEHAAITLKAQALSQSDRLIKGELFRMVEEEKI